jgi:saccharopine dehydrogenase (NAD+, L-lysine-forming)
MTILLLGGYGAVGYETAKIALNRTDAEIVIAGRSLEKAQFAAVKLKKETNNAHVSGKSIDAFNYNEVVAAFEMVDWVIVCIPLTGLGSKLAQAAYKAGVHYIDINANQQKQAYLQSMAAKIKQKGFTFVSEAGCAPGLPSLLVLYAYEQLGKLNTVDIGSIFRESKISYGSAYDLLVELAVKHRVFKNGAWRKATLFDGKEIDFGASYGKHHCYPFEVFELVKLPVKELGVNNLGLYAAGFNPVVDMLVLVWMMTGLYKFDASLRLGAKIAMWAGKFTKPPFCTVIQVDATAQNGSRMRIRLVHEDAYIATAIPLAACMTQMLAMDLFSQKGLHLMGHFLKADKFLEEIKSMGMKVEIEREQVRARQVINALTF